MEQARRPGATERTPQ
uniref:Vpr n=1 Tax=Human immunodeficiency virus type 1 TaxID=11676 RepID=Q0EBA9_HV1|nr:Vpr [Human immunodeficiency virus 1]